MFGRLAGRLWQRPVIIESTEKNKEYVFALIAKNQGNPVFQAARIGAEDAARDLSKNWACGQGAVADAQ